MSRAIKFAIVLITLAIVFAIGYPLSSEGGEAGFAERHPYETSRCFKIGDANSYFRCLVSSHPRLTGAELISTVAGRMNQIMFPFGLLFFITLALFILCACLLF